MSRDLYLLMPDGIYLRYRLERRRGMKRIYLYADQHEVSVRAAPRVPLQSVEEFILSQADWIRERQSRSLPAIYEHGGTLYYRGRQRKILIEKSNDKNRMRMGARECRFFLSPGNRERLVTDLLAGHCRREAAAVLLPRVEYWSDRMGLEPRSVTFRRARTRWGSCSVRNTLSLNLWLMLPPQKLSDYVIIHELAHIRHKNHSRDFWNLVERYCPDWKERRRALRSFEPYLL